MNLTRPPFINSIEQFWLKHELGIQLAGWILVLFSAANGFVWR